MASSPYYRPSQLTEAALPRDGSRDRPLIPKDHQAFILGPEECVHRYGFHRMSLTAIEPTAGEIRAGECDARKPLGIGEEQKPRQMTPCRKACEKHWQR